MTDWERHWHDEQRARAYRPGTWSAAVTEHAFAHWDRVFARHAPGRRLLECGSGAARFSQHMAARGYACTLLDRSPSGLELGRKAFREAGMAARALLGDVTAIGLADGQFDAVYTGGMLEFVDAEGAIAEMVRVLRPGGLFAANIVPDKWSAQTLADWQRTAFHAARAAASFDLRGIFRRVRFFPAGEEPKPTRLGEYRQYAERAGLTVLAATGTSPFPYLSLPAVAQRAYAGVMTRLEPAWRRFDESTSRWSEVWGLAYTMYGIKADGASR